MPKELVTAFAQRRLEALEHVASAINGNPCTEKTPFVLPVPAHYEDKAHDLAHALDEFVTIERWVTLNDWKATRHAPPERRVLMGEALLVRVRSGPTARCRRTESRKRTTAPKARRVCGGIPRNESRQTSPLAQSPSCGMQMVA